MRFNRRREMKFTSVATAESRDRASEAVGSQAEDRMALDQTLATCPSVRGRHAVSGMMATFLSSFALPFSSAIGAGPRCLLPHLPNTLGPALPALSCNAPPRAVHRSVNP
jgi:hypothetical protein